MITNNLLKKSEIKKYIVGFVLIILIILFLSQDKSSFKWIFLKNFEKRLSDKMSPRTRLLLLYEEMLSLFESNLFYPRFHNHRLILKLNLTTISKDRLNYFQNNKIHHLKIICLKDFNYQNSSRIICEIDLIFGVNIKNVSLNSISKNGICSLLLRNRSDTILIDIHGTFLINDTFRFTSQWSKFEKKKLISWFEWPLSRRCLNFYLNNFDKNRNKLSKFDLKLFNCFQLNILKHSNSRELYIKEQNAVSYWLDLQYNSSINQISNKRNLIPFELTKNTSICSEKFQNWILNYQKWHENITFYINNGSMSIEEQRNRIIELDVRFLIYEKPGSGIADRLVHLISTYFVALLTKRLFIFDKNWFEFDDIMQSSLNYDQNSVIPWLKYLDFLNKNLSKIDLFYLKNKSQIFSFDRFVKDYDYDKIYPERILIFKGHTGGIIHTINSNSSIYRNFLINDLQMNTNNIFGCIYHSFFTYKLSELIRRIPFTFSHQQFGHSSQQILQTFLSPNIFSIGVQIRTGDGTIIETEIEQSELFLREKLILRKYQNFFKCSQDILHEDIQLLNKTKQIPIIFLMSDSFQVRQAALRRWQFSFDCFYSFQNKCQWNNHDLFILSSANPVFHVQYTKDSIAFKLGMFDIFLFSLCDQHLISTDSGFGRFPAFASLKQRNIYTLALREQKSCLNASLKLSVVGYHWSGI